MNAWQLRALKLEDPVTTQPGPCGGCGQESSNSLAVYFIVHEKEVVDLA